MDGVDDPVDLLVVTNDGYAATARHALDAEFAVTVVATVEATVDVAIADTGPGIPAVEQEIVTGKQAIEPLYHGVGLGPWLVSWIARRSGGTLEFEDNDSSGTVVRLHFPQEVDSV